MTEFPRNQYDGGGREEMVFAEISGGLKTATAADTISICPNRPRQRHTPYIAKCSKIREITYFAEGIFDSKTRTLSHNRIYPSGRGGSSVGAERRPSTSAELEQIDQFSWTHVFETSTKDQSQCPPQCKLSYRARVW